MISTTVVGGAQVVASFTAGSVQSGLKARAIVRKHTQLLRTRIQAKASGRPGPNAPTGDYRRSWGTSFMDGAGWFAGAAGTNAVQGRRLELGFVGTDSLGRHYNQPPYPHVGPATEEIEPGFVRELAEIVEDL